MTITRDNHYVPRLYLNNFTSRAGEVFSYRLLVPHPGVRNWDRFSVAGTGYQKNLYTRIERGEETDDIEQWLNREFENPVKEPLCKVLNDEELAESDWRALVRFLAVQIVRTPAFLIENLPVWNELAPKVLDRTMADADEQIRLAKASGRKIVVDDATDTRLFPMRILRTDLPEEQKVQITTKVLVGRGLWFYTMRHTLTNTIQVLHRHRWSILLAPDGLEWFTSDDPVVRLNYRSEADYDFKGGWGRPGGNIFLPLSPRHLLFTEIGAVRPPRQTPKRYHARMIRRFIAEHAHRRIYSAHEDIKIPTLRPRFVNAEQFSHEHALWEQWFENQTQAEREIFRNA
jgi:hypothetical protein